MQDDAGKLILVALAVVGTGAIAWWTFVRLPPLIEARSAELRSPPRGTLRSKDMFKHTR